MTTAVTLHIVIRTISLVFVFKLFQIFILPLLFVS